ncbi:hypothetical protein VE03_05415 [Pseudogymnoascus sp. 23342-1-I1]|nr:hypothetical protein VE03_05415 [Pseudogymnoascus sp. 23342-1-I1]
MTSSKASSTITEQKRSPLPDNETVRVIGISEYLAAAECLAKAFGVDTLCRYFVDADDTREYSEERKWKLHSDILRYMVAAHCYQGFVTTIGPNYDAVALWLPPGKGIDDWWTILRSGTWRLFFSLSHEGKTRFYSEFLPLLHYTKKRVLGERDDKSYYLDYIGTKPSARGKGYARKLIEHGLAMADAEGAPTYLESTAAVNVPYYEKFGFQYIKEVHLQRDEKPVSLSIMVREPRANAGVSQPLSKQKCSVKLVELVV